MIVFQTTQYEAGRQNQNTIRNLFNRIKTEIKKHKVKNENSELVYKQLR